MSEVPLYPTEADERRAMAEGGAGGEAEAEAQEDMYRYI